MTGVTSESRLAGSMRFAALGALALIAGCGGPDAPSVQPPSVTPWTLPDGWRAESFPFPLEFATSIHHAGVEELRFPPGMFEQAAPDYWSYAFVWRLDDQAELTPARLADELTAYFRGLLIAVDGDKHHITDPTAIHVDVQAADGADVVTAHILDAFTTGQPVELTGFAARARCRGDGALWKFAFAPAGRTAMLGVVTMLAMNATCGQPVLETKKS